jgi:hypothetical protein
MIDLAEKLAEAIREEAPETIIWMDGFIGRRQTSMAAT